MKLPDDIDIHVSLSRDGNIVVDSLFDRAHPGLMDRLQPFVEDNIVTDDDGEERIDWPGVEKDWEKMEGGS